MVESAAQLGSKPEPHVTPLNIVQHNRRCISCTYLSMEEAQQECYAVGIFHLHHNPMRPSPHVQPVLDQNALT